MLKVLIPAVAALGLVAFAARSQGSPPEIDSAPAMSWSVHHEGALAKLAYGVPNSDQLALMVACMPGDATAAVYGDVRIVGARLTQASLTVDPLSGGDADVGLIPVRDPALAALAQDGRLTVEGDAGRFVVPASREERRLVHDFLSYCAPDRA